MGEVLGYISDVFGYVLNWIYNLVNNYGVAIILFTVLIKLIILPITIKQQKTMKKTAKIQEKVKEIQFKYKGNKEKINQETIELYKREKMSPCSGCFSSIIQIVLLLSVFYLVSQPLTHMRRVDNEIVQTYINEMKENNQTQNMTYPQIAVIREKGPVDDRININMNFLGLDLSSVPKDELKDFRVYIIPAIYVITSIISIRLTTKTAPKKKKEEVVKQEGEEAEVDLASQMSKNMTFIMPIMSVMISMIAPLGLALYWLTNNILTIAERLLIEKLTREKEETVEQQ